MANEIKLKDLARVFNEGTTLQKAGNKARAKEKYDQVLFHEKALAANFLQNTRAARTDRNLVTALLSNIYNNLGIFLEEQGLTGQAVEHFRKSLKYLPGNIETLTNMSRVLTKRRNLDGALEAVEKALDQNPSYAPAVIQFSKICYAQRYNQKALPVLEKAELKIGRNARFFVEYGRHLQALNALSEARGKFLKALEVDPNDIPALINLASVSFRLGRFQEALDSYTKILTLKPDHSLALTGLGSLFQHLGQFGDAEKCYQKSLAITPDHAETLGFYSSLLELKGDYKSALKVVGNLLETPRLSERAIITGYLTKANCERKLGRFDDALATMETFKRLVKSPLGLEKAENRLGLIHDQIGQFGKAFEHFSKAKTYFKTNAKDFETFKGEATALMDKLAAAKWAPAKNAGKGPRAPLFILNPIMGGSSVLGDFLEFAPACTIYREIHATQGLRNRLAEQKDGYPGALDNLGDEEVEHLRAVFEEVNAKAAREAGDTLAVHIDYLNLIDLPLILKLYPNAKLAVLKNHPADVVLNCFIHDFQPSKTTANFGDLKSITGFYVKSMALWGAYQKGLGPTLHEVRYENLLKAPGKETQALLKFAGHGEAKAAKKAFDSEAFYQKADFLEKEAPAGRWKNYRIHLEEALKELAPNIKALGYEA